MSKGLDIQGTGMTSQRTRSRMVARLRQQGIMDEHVLDVIDAIPRHVFIDEALAHRAYEDTALPIGFNQTISQPYIVARMTEALFAAGPLTKVLEIGTGSGYQTAVLAQLADKIYSVERIQGLLDKAKERLRMLGNKNTQFKYDDGNIGWPDRGPYDGIIVTASPRHVPRELLNQLAPEGRLIVPVGDEQQQLKLITNHDGEFETEVLEDVKFVPLLGGKA
ncbi:MAG: protein-L-isoaspartate(D-aspartate) O-methyltransferase [Pseudomonadales bacterium]|nr:protein-L-isoaspartate(D-aspartate) O-methyltransferase [Pseudomonadales bacterium]MDG1442155.1 protein-L-isoaspartate(D-aspartate) O-methyltransferase [Pseudomonadales bacterium]